MGEGATIYLAKPGGEPAGPFTLDQVRQGVAAETYRDTDYWAWQDGLPSWVPLYELPGVFEDAAAAAAAATQKNDELASGMPFSALERIFLFTTGDGPAAWHAPAVTQMLEATVGKDISTIRTDVPRDVVGQCEVAKLLKSDGSLSDAAWLTMGSHQPRLVQQARERLLRVCVRTFRIGTGTVAALVLFYNKQKA